MADYFTYLSVAVPLPDAVAQQYALRLANQALSFVEGGELPPDFPASLADVAEDWLFETEPESSPGKWGLWLHSENGGIDAVCEFIRHLLQKFEPAGRVSFEWSNDCSRPRLDAYGGGAAFITARKIRTMTTVEWLRRQSTSRALKPLTERKT